MVNIIQDYIDRMHLLATALTVLCEYCRFRVNANLSEELLIPSAMHARAETRSIKQKAPMAGERLPDNGAVGA
jgi:hypothetical protein